MEYKGYCIEPIEALTGQQDNEEYTITGSRTVYQVRSPIDGYVYVVTTSLERAKKIVDTQSKRWQAQQRQSALTPVNLPCL